MTKEKGDSLARSQNIPFLETSAKTNYNIDEAFEKLARLILKKVGVFYCFFCFLFLFCCCIVVSKCLHRVCGKLTFTLRYKI